MIFVHMCSLCWLPFKLYYPNLLLLYIFHCVTILILSMFRKPKKAFRNLYLFWCGFHLLKLMSPFLVSSSWCWMYFAWNLVTWAWTIGGEPAMLSWCNLLNGACSASWVSQQHLSWQSFLSLPSIELIFLFVMLYLWLGLISLT